MSNAKFCFVFPGQGSQSVGMLADLAQTYPRVRETFEEASAGAEVDLWKLTQEDPDRKLNQTEFTQPAMLAAGVAVWRVWTDRGGGVPLAMAGHSLGEYTALVCAGSLDFGTAASLVSYRGRVMQQAVPSDSGAMAAILGLDDGKVRTVCEEAAGSQVVEAVNFNAPGQVVIAGEREAVERAIGLAKQAGAKRALPLPVSVPSHCALMRSAAVALHERLESTTFRAPQVPVLHNASVTSAKSPEEIRSLLARQLYSPVRWVETIAEMKNRVGVERVLEAGPGKVLTGLTKRIESGLSTIAVFDTASMEKALTEICDA